MKMTYIQPQTVVIKTELNNTLLTTSNPGASVDMSDAGVAPGDFEVHENKGWDIWDNEDASEE